MVNRRKATPRIAGPKEPPLKIRRATKKLRDLQTPSAARPIDSLAVLLDDRAKR